jgi:hypothetical protein
VELQFLFVNVLLASLYYMSSYITDQVQGRHASVGALSKLYLGHIVHCHSFIDLWRRTYPYSEGQWPFSDHDSFRCRVQAYDRSFMLVCENPIKISCVWSVFRHYVLYTDPARLNCVRCHLIFSAKSLKLFSFHINIWVLSLELASYHPSGAHSLEVAATFWENFVPCFMLRPTVTNNKWVHDEIIALVIFRF